jgi:hypothetical protein
MSTILCNFANFLQKNLPWFSKTNHIFAKTSSSLSKKRQYICRIVRRKHFKNHNIGPRTFGHLFSHEPKWLLVFLPLITPSILCTYVMCLNLFCFLSRFAKISLNGRGDDTWVARFFWTQCTKTVKYISKYRNITKW